HATATLREAGAPVNIVTVTILRDSESPGWWLANFTWDDRTYTTQGAVVDEACYMAADLLTLMGAGPETEATFLLDHHETLASVLARPVTPSLHAEPAGGEVAARS
ncbi:MAG: hypothetical protein QOD51_157, partial [Candidatus Eremiobacteraeota bacterium]|nr:hypothetical protein [Candidatus Eremiobacteraeota bacterium]